MHSSLQPAIDADETLPEMGAASISEMIAETLAMMGSNADATWPDVLAPQRRATKDMAFTKTF